MNLKELGQKNIELISNHFISGDFNGLLRSIITGNDELSISSIARELGCSRRSLRRYLSNERPLPIVIVKRLVKSLGLDESYIFSIMKNDAETYCSSYAPTLNQYNQIIWYGSDHMLVNFLFWYRKNLSCSMFELAYKTNISPEHLSNYESGKRPIPKLDVRKICSGLSIELQDLFPQLFSYDGNNTYLPLGLHLLTDFNSSSHFDILDDYCSPDILQSWPISRYNRFGQPIMSVMPDELTMDEFYNTDPIVYVKNDLETYWESAPFPLASLPPNYFRLHTMFLFPEAIKRTKVPLPFIAPDQVIKIDFIEPYQICFYWKRKIKLLDISPYIDSGSSWYQKLKDYDYFKLGYLSYADDRFPDSQCVFWPGGQYIRIIDIELDQHSTDKNFYYQTAGIKTTRLIENWLIWE